MIRVLAFLLLLAGCAELQPGQRPGTDYHVRTPQEITRICELYGKPHCDRTLGLAVYDLAVCQVFVPPLTTATAYVWKHEERHCDEGNWHAGRD